MKSEKVRLSIPFCKSNENANKSGGFVLSLTTEAGRANLSPIPKLLLPATSVIVAVSAVKYTIPISEMSPSTSLMRATSSPRDTIIVSLSIPRG